ncbi:MAG: valine--tRNA ligase [Anaerolineales bacterium]
MSAFELPKTYEFSQVEQRLYEWWEQQGYFKPDEGSKKDPFVISMPPPNVTGELHLGHSMFVSLEDLMTRYHRMKGQPALWLPGTDHAGIATQLQVEKHLLRTEEVTRREIGREAFEAKVWEWKEKYGDIITNQIRRLGASCDWSRQRFTLDQGLSDAVREAFVRLYEKGLIYRGDYMINWSPGLQTAVSDLEVEYHEEQGTLYYFKYRIKGEETSIPVATTRPETILGDTAVAVHPDDDRFRALVGRTALVPILDREIPVIADSYVDREFGTGALKITPGHDPNDYEIGHRHDLEFINILNADASMNENAGPYQGLDRFECRDRIWADMNSAGLTLKKEPYTMQVPRTQRGGEVVEPMLSTQWFVKMEPLARPALEAVRDGRIEIVPPRFAKVYFNWLENIRDWCISRQLWWGHRIPAWHCDECGQITVTRQDPTECAHCGSANIRQDPDVLDTWFSSGLWPFSTLGWPKQTEDLDRYYPTTMMETGYDILFFWVARMIMMGLEFTDQVPFHTVYLHGIIRDANGSKMSKTLGNVIDPLDVMDEFGTDALRFTLLTGSTPGNDMNLSLERVEANRNFANKVWNAGRLVLMSLERAPARTAAAVNPTAADRWILARRGQLIRAVDRLFANHQYGEAGRQIYEFFWAEFADWYLEIAKLQLEQGPDRAWQTASIMVDVLDSCLRLLHPFTPFVTEELWGHLKRACQDHPAGFAPTEGWSEALMIAEWPTAAGAADDEAVDAFRLVMDLVRSVRNLRSEREVEASRKPGALIIAGDRQEWFEEQSDTIAWLARLNPDRMQFVRSVQSPPQDSIPLVVGPIEAYIPLSDLLDVGAERERLHGELDEIDAQIVRLQALLAGPFSQKAPDEVVTKERERLAEYQQSKDRLERQIESLS